MSGRNKFRLASSLRERRPHDAIDRDFDAHLERIRGFLRIPSVSANDGDLRSTADAVCRLIEAAGGRAEPREPGERRPTVIGVIDGPGPTVLRYGMYDVQPSGAQWTVDPFAATLRDGRVIARGAANSKGALAASILALASAPSPCRQVLVCEGEEELGSPRLAAFCDAHRDELAADFALDLDLQEEPGSVFAGVKGLYELELTSGGGPDVHSSRVTTVPEPAVDLARALVALKDRVPAANVTWMLAGTPEDVSRTVVPGTARAGVDIRFEDPVDLPAMTDGVSLAVRGTYPPARSDPEGPPVRALCEALRRHGTEPRVRPVAPWWAPYHVLGAIGRPAPAGGDRRRPRARARGADLRRAGLDARRVGPRAGAEGADGPARVALAGAAVHHPRPRAGVDAVRPDRGHVPRPDRRAGQRAAGDRAPAPPVHAGAGGGGPGARPRARRAAARRRAARRVAHPARPPAAPALPAALRAVRQGGPPLFDAGAGDHRAACLLLRSGPQSGSARA